MDYQTVLDTASNATRATGVLSVLASVPTAAGAIATGEWTAIAVGAAVAGITGVFAVVGLIKDKRNADLRDQIEDLVKENREERHVRKAAEDLSDQWERRCHRAERQLAELGGTPDPDSDQHP